MRSGGSSWQQVRTSQCPSEISPQFSRGGVPRIASLFEGSSNVANLSDSSENYDLLVATAEWGSNYISSGVALAPCKSASLVYGGVNSSVTFNGQTARSSNGLVRRVVGIKI